MHYDKLRRIWSPAFSDKALRDYEVRIRPYGEQLQRQLAASQGKPVDVFKLFNYYPFDVIGGSGVLRVV